MSPSEFKAIRLRHKLTQSELASILRISDIRSIRRWECGDRAISGTVQLIMEMLDADELPIRYFRT